MTTDREMKHKQLRERAEAILAKLPNELPEMSMEDIKSVVHDLSVYQIELELQNEELQFAQQQMERARDGFARLYNQAPVGYLSLNQHGVIVQANQTFGEMVGENVADITGRPFVDLIVRPDQGIFLGRFSALYKNPSGKTLEVRLKKTSGGSLSARITGRLEPEITFTANARESAPVLLIVVNDVSERKEAEESLVKSERKFRRFIELSEDAIVLTDEHGTVTEWSRGAEKIFCIPEENALGRPLWDIQFQVGMEEMRTPVNYDRLKASLQAHLITGQGPMLNRLTETMIQCADGAVKDIQSLVFSIQSDKGFALGSITRDISKRKLAEARLRYSEAKFRAVVESSNDGILFADANGIITYRSPASFRLSGYSDEERVGKNIFEIIHPDDLERVRQPWAEIVAHPGRLLKVELRIWHKDGRCLWIESTLLSLLDNPDIQQIIVTSRDITDRKQAEEALRESEDKFHQLFISMTEGMALHEVYYDNTGRPTDYRIVDVNPAFEMHTGIDSQLASSMFASELYGEPLFLDRYAEVASTGQPQAFETYVPELKKHFRISAISPRRGTFATIFEDITERKRWEEELMQRNEEIMRFSYTVSHDLKSPLVTINSFLGYLEEDAQNGDQESLRKDISYIRQATEKMGRLLDELLELSRVGQRSIIMQEVPLQFLVEAAKTMLAGRLANRAVEMQVTDAPVVLYGDVGYLEQVFQNLMENAVKYMGNQPNPRVEIGVQPQESGAIVLFVRDNGIGIDPRYQHRLFNLFEKLDPTSEGTGIGLALVKRVIEVHGGKIWVESEGDGKGTTFYFTLAHTKMES